MSNKLYDYWVNRNNCVKYEYERYVKEHIAEHYLHRFRHIRLLLKLNRHFVTKEIDKPMLYWDDPQHPVYHKTVVKNIPISTESNESILKTSMPVTNDNYKPIGSDIVKEPFEYIRKKIIISNKNRILYISNTGRTRPILDPSARYRCYHAAEILHSQGIYASVTTLASFIKEPLPLDFDVYIFHRPGTAAIENIRKLKHYQKTVIADYDDLIFGDENIALQSSLFLNGNRDAEEVIDIYKRNLLALKEFNIFTCSTEHLATAIKAQCENANVFVIHNFLPPSILKKTSDCLKKKKDMNQIVYCCGTQSHNKDFKIVEEAIVRCLKKDTTFRFFLIGPLKIGDELNRLPNVYFHSAVDYWDLFEIMSNSAFAIAPLENSIFNNCKSNVKFLESAATGVTLLASPIPDMVRVKDSGIILCTNEVDFEKYIMNRYEEYDEEAMISNRMYLEQFCGPETFNAEFASLLKYLEEEY